MTCRYELSGETLSFICIYLLVYFSLCLIIRSLSLELDSQIVVSWDVLLTTFLFQAQARCHRIGQSKAVKIYRLITRNSYEREMFDKASLKLGLDKAVLQSMSGRENANSGVRCAPSNMLKELG